MFHKTDFFLKKNGTAALSDLTNVVYYPHINEAYRGGQTWRHVQRWPVSHQASPRPPSVLFLHPFGVYGRKRLSRPRTNLRSLQRDCSSSQTQPWTTKAESCFTEWLSGGPLWEQSLLARSLPLISHIQATLSRPGLRRGLCKPLPLH